MPGFPVAASGTSHYRNTDQPNHEDVHLSAEENLAAEESFAIYCLPVEFYNSLQRRAEQKPLFRQRCLNYKIKAKHKKRVQMTVSLTWSDEETQSVLPLYICLARRDRNTEDAQNKKYSSVHRISRIFIFRDSSSSDENTQIQANFRLPEVNKLAEEARSGSLAVLFFTNVAKPNSSSGDNASVVPFDPTHCESRDEEEYCLCGKVSLESLYMSWDSTPRFRLGQRVEIMSSVDLVPCSLKRDFTIKYKNISIQDHCSFENEVTSKNVQFTISAEDFGAKLKSPYLLDHAINPVRSSSLSPLIRLKDGNVIFNYRYYHNKLQKTEVTENFVCPFCLVSCASYEGLKYHLPSSHDLFNYEFPEPEGCQAVNVSLRSGVRTDSPKLFFDNVAEGIDPKLQTFFYCGKRFSYSSPENASFENANDLDPLVLEYEIPAGNTEPSEKADENADGASSAIIVSNPDSDRVPSIPEHEGASSAIIVSNPDSDRVPSIPEHEVPSIPEHGHGTPAVLQVAKRGKLPVELSDSRSIVLLKKRTFYHSRTAQPMALEEVLADEDSEDEVDDDVRDIEGRKLLDNFDLSAEEKKFMQMWNTFARKQRVQADGHISWAYEAFSKLHAPELAQSPKLEWCWRLSMIKLWNHNLLDGRTFKTCSVILQEFKKQISDPQS